MPIYTVHQPRLRKYETAPDPERFAFVRDGFSFWAFLFGPLWMLRHRMWLVLLGYVVVAALLFGGLRWAGVGGVSTLAGFLLALLVGLEAGTLRRFTLGRRRWKNLGVIVADSRQAAERRFFDSWVRGETLAPLDPERTPLPKPAAPAPGQAVPDVIGLFPQPGAHR
jgi:hypothetical protein